MSEYLYNQPPTFKVPQSDGYLKIADGVKISVLKRPNRFHRLMLRLFLGWGWEE